jgi:intraflagellar transport protein 81
VNNIFAKLDKKNDVKLKEEGPEKTLERFIEFLRILSYPGRFDEETIKSFMNGDKKVLQPIIYFCLANFDGLIKRAYLGKFLVPIVIPDEHLVDEEMKTSYNDYMSLLEEFKENHRVYDEKMKGASNPQTLKKEIGQLEHEKEQLNNRIKEFREKYDKKADFQDLLKEITMMRKEQEEESNLVDKLRQQKRLLDKCDNDLLMSQQKLIDTKRAVGDESSAEEMLYALKSDVARTKNKITEIQFEVREKRKKLAENDSKLYDPLPPPDQIEGMKNKVSALRNIVSDLSRKLEREKSPEKEDKLFIQKQQEQMVKNQKEKVENEMKKLEVEKTDLEEKIRDKTKDLVFEEFTLRKS